MAVCEGTGPHWSGPGSLLWTLIHTCLEMWSAEVVWKKVLDFIDAFATERAQAESERSEWHLAGQ